MVRLLTLKVSSKSDGWDYFFSSLEKAFASENVSDEFKPKVLLCMLGDKVSNLLVNLGEEELRDYESFKQVVLKEYEPSSKICLENFRKAKWYPDETFFQFASRFTSMWLYYCKLRGEQCDIFYASKGKSYNGPARAKWNDSEKRSFHGNWGRDCPKNKGVNNKRLNVNKVSTEGTKLEDETVAAGVDLLGGACKNLAPSPGNRSSRYEDLAAGKVYREEDLATRGRDWTTLDGGPREGEETRYEEKTCSGKEERWTM
ncbi:retrovirus-related Pol polyprotein from transposon opus [Nephila pilipes]|uniref:Retrovirus-related Pol polyprotein from transposon opus n=1 Tax=Nephila pilipes TaxID=299642 RepID=A0A8X6UTJ5_NEPPI|nr:retrovirus-related Pol polyprotein from transposon opus [Nephila pilipes]